jgi:fatty-acyl-CoA synthase
MALTAGFRVARRTGLLDPTQWASSTVALARWGPTLASAYAAAALRHPRRAAVVDHRGSVSFAKLDRRSTALARGLLELGLRRGQHLGLLCHNHRHYAEANLAAVKAGLPVVHLNTGFAPPQLAEVAGREGVAALICDADLLAVALASGYGGPIVVADTAPEPTSEAAGPLVDADAEPTSEAAGPPVDADAEPTSEAAGLGAGLPTVQSVRRAGGRSHRAVLLPRITNPVLLTSGTTGAPKGAQRHGQALDLRGAAGLLQRIPYQRGDVVVIPCPLFHTWGLTQLMLAASLGSTAVLLRRFEPEETMRAVADHRATVLAVVPVMLQRMLSGDRIEAHDLSSLRVVVSSGSALPAAVATAWMDRVGDTLYNLYGSTEVGQATIATPTDLRSAPGTAGRVVGGSSVAILDHGGRTLAPGATGRIFVGNRSQFAGYTGGGGKEMAGGLMSSGDLGYCDRDGRLFVTGRSDDMIVSGGENVFPAEVEDVLLAHPAIADAAVVGVDDPELGQRLAAFVTTAPGAVIDARAVRELVASRLARHKVPRDVHVVGSIPRTATGKVRRRELAQSAAEATSG